MIKTELRDFIFSSEHSVDEKMMFCTDNLFLPSQITENVYSCYNCNYKTKRTYDFNNHLKTKKHMNNLLLLENNKSSETRRSVCRNINSFSGGAAEANNDFFVTKCRKNTYICLCKKKYKGKNGRQMLYIHKSNCDTYNKTKFVGTKCRQMEHIKKFSEREEMENFSEKGVEKNIFSSERSVDEKEITVASEGKLQKNAYEEYIKTIQTQNELLNKIIKNQEEKINETKKETMLIQKQLLEYMKKINNQEVNITNNNNQTNNKTININIFLNEKCKNALSIEEFVNTLNMSVEKVEEYANAGYVNWVTDVLIDGFRKTDIEKRPIHCSDLKREVLYVKNENKWEKDLEYKYFDKFLTKISKRYSSLYNEWCNITPLHYIQGTQEYETGVKVLCNTHSDEKKQKKILNSVKDKIYLHKTQLNDYIEEE